MVRVQKLTRRFGNAVVLDGIDLEVDAGHCVALTGSKGAGRTTLLRVLAALHRPTSGQVEVAGVDVSRSPIEARARTMYVSSELPGATHLRASEYVDFVRHTRGRRASRLSTLDALRRADVPADADIDRLSPSMRMRLALTVALVVAPPLLLVDEPFASLDAFSRAHFTDWLTETRAGGTTIIASVRDGANAASLCDIEVRMDHGRIVSRVQRAPAGRAETTGAR